MSAKYLIRRLLIAIVQLVAVTVVVFFLIRILPADPVSRLVGLNASPESYTHARESLGLDKSVPKQLGLYLGFFPGEKRGLLEGDLGVSWVTGSPVSSEIGRFFPITLELVTFSFIIALLIAVPVGVIGALRAGGFVDRCIYVYGLFAGAQPEFWWGLTFIYLFFFRWHLAPAPLGRLDPLTSEPPSVTGAITIDSLIAGEFGVFVQAAYHLMLPVLTLAFVLSGPMIKMVRQNMSRVMESDFTLYARSSGLPESRIAAYTFRNAFAPSLTLIGILFGYMIGGAVLVEQVFSLGGLGQYAVRSILQFDYPAIQGVVLVITAFSVFTYLMLDVIHALIDPRIAY